MTIYFPTISQLPESEPIKKGIDNHIWGAIRGVGYKKPLQPFELQRCTKLICGE